MLLIRIIHDILSVVKTSTNVYEYQWHNAKSKTTITTLTATTSQSIIKWICLHCDNVLSTYQIKIYIANRKTSTQLWTAQHRRPEPREQFYWSIETYTIKDLLWIYNVERFCYSWEWSNWFCGYWWICFFDDFTLLMLFNINSLDMSSMVSWLIQKHA